MSMVPCEEIKFSVLFQVRCQQILVLILNYKLAIFHRRFQQGSNSSDADWLQCSAQFSLRSQSVSQSRTSRRLPGNLDRLGATPQSGQTEKHALFCYHCMSSSGTCFVHFNPWTKIHGQCRVPPTGKFSLQRRPCSSRNRDADKQDTSYFAN